MTRTTPSQDRDLFLAALVDDAADGQRVLWVGDAASRGPLELAERAELLVLLDTGDGSFELPDDATFEISSKSKNDTRRGQSPTRHRDASLTPPTGY